MAKVTITNTSPGPRGFYVLDGSYVELAPGQSRDDVELSANERKSAERTGYFAFGADAAEEAAGELPNNALKLQKIARDEGIDVGEAKTVGELQAAITAGRAAKGAGGGTPNVTPPDDLDRMSDEELRATVQVITGKEAPADADRGKLLELARGVE